MTHMNLTGPSCQSTPPPHLLQTPNGLEKLDQQIPVKKALGILKLITSAQKRRDGCQIRAGRRKEGRSEFRLEKTEEDGAVRKQTDDVGFWIGDRGKDAEARGDGVGEQLH